MSKDEYILARLRTLGVATVAELADGSPWKPSALYDTIRWLRLRGDVVAMSGRPLRVRLARDHVDILVGLFASSASRFDFEAAEHAAAVAFYERDRYVEVR